MGRSGTDSDEGSVGRQRVGAVLGSYRLLDVLGQGAMGCVYLAEHTLIHRKVALKLLHRRYSNNPEAVERIFAEARAVNRVAHENVLEITDFVHDGAGENYYISELLSGESLRQRLDREKIPPLEVTLSIAQQMAAGLSVVHEAGIIHRDLKPENVFLTPRDDGTLRVKLLDFGVAELRYEESLQTTLPSTGGIVGTPLYMSPEQAAAEPIDARSDIYSFGVVLYQLVAGKTPFFAKSLGQLVIKHTTSKPPPPSQVPGLPHVVPPPLEALILQCLAREPGERPQRMKDILERLRGMARVAGGPVRATSTMALLEVPPQRRRGWVLPAAVLGTAVLVGGALLGLRALREPSPAVTVAAPPTVVVVAPSPPPSSPLPSPAARITLTLDSTPPGAEVVQGGVSLGKTPLVQTLERADRSLTYELRLPGRAPVRRDVSLQTDAVISVAFAPAPPLRNGRPLERTQTGSTTKQVKAPGKSGKKLERGGVLEPFDE